MLQEKNFMHFGLLYILEFFSCNEQPLTEEIPHLSCLDFPSAELKVVHTDANKMTVKHKQMNMDRYRQAMSQTCIELNIRIYFWIHGYLFFWSSSAKASNVFFHPGVQSFLLRLFSAKDYAHLREREKIFSLCTSKRLFLKGADNTLAFEAWCCVDAWPTFSKNPLQSSFLFLREFAH